MRARLLLAAAALAAFGASLVSGFHFDDYAIFADPLCRPASAGWKFRRAADPPAHLSHFLVEPRAGRARSARLPRGQPGAAPGRRAAASTSACCKLVPQRAAWLAAALFAVHPIQAEAVDYIWGRGIVLAGVFCAASLWAWLDGRRWLAVVWFGLALLAKEECAAFPLVWLMLEWRRASAQARNGPVSKHGPTSPHAGPRLRRRGARHLCDAPVTPGAPAGLQAGISPWQYFLAQGVVIPRYTCGCWWFPTGSRWIPKSMFRRCGWGCSVAADGTAAAGCEAHAELAVAGGGVGAPAAQLFYLSCRGSGRRSAHVSSPVLLSLRRPACGWRR